MEKQWIFDVNLIICDENLSFAVFAQGNSYIGAVECLYALGEGLVLALWFIIGYLRPFDLSWVHSSALLLRYDITWRFCYGWNVVVTSMGCYGHFRGTSCLLLARVLYINVYAQNGAI